MLDYGTWLPTRMQQSWKYAEAKLPVTPSNCWDVHPSVADALVRSSLVRLKRCMVYQKSSAMINSEEEKAYGDIVYSWMRSRGLCDIGTLLNHAFDILESQSAKITLGERYINAALTVTVLCCIRKFGGEARFNGVDIRDASHVIFPKLLDTLQKVIEHATKEEKDRFGEAILWMWFTGAHFSFQYTKYLEATNPEGLAGCAWDYQQLALQAHGTGLTRWTNAAPVLNQFVWSEVMEPRPEEWYDDTISQYYPGCEGQA